MHKSVKGEDQCGHTPDEAKTIQQSQLLGPVDSRKKPPPNLFLKNPKTTCTNEWFCLQSNKTTK